MKNQLQNCFSNDTDSGRDFGGNPGKAGALVTVPGLERILSAGIPGDLLVESGELKCFMIPFLKPS